jgi:gas vesicle protein
VTFNPYFHRNFFSKPIIFKEVPMRKMFGFLIGVFVGALVGSTIALLLAPEAGDELRSELRERGQNFVGEVRQAADTRRIELKDRLDTLRAPKG